MLFNSIEFLFCFLPIVFTIYFLLNKTKFKKYSNLWLLLSSLYFYAYFKVEYLPLILLSIVVNYFFGLLIQRTNHKKLFMILAVCLNLALLCYFKYFNFVLETLNNLTFTHFDTMKLLLPLGISFFTFQQIGYIYDVYKKDAPYSNFVDYALFVSFFPQLIAGPICTFSELTPQLQDENKKKINRDNINIGFFLIVVGLAKKVLIADNFAPFIEQVILNEAMSEFFTSWAFALSIALQGYFDFSGYCDMALGIGMLFNITLPINFNSPYKSLDISDYWRRWHITMGRFLKYQVYIPMGGSRCSAIRHYWNLFFVFLVTGIWHGANWPCIFYGTINGILVCINKLWKNTKIEMNKNLAIFITFTTMVFIAPLVMIKHIHQYFMSTKSMIGLNGFDTVSLEGFNFVFQNQNLKLNFILLLISLIIVFCFKNSNEIAPKYLKSKNISYTIILVVVFVISVLSITKGSEFIYFNF